MKLWIVQVSTTTPFEGDGKPAEHLQGLYELPNVTPSYTADVLTQVLADMGFLPKLLLLMGLV